MRTLGATVLALLVSLTALPTHAADLESPDLGLRVRHLPDSVGKPLILKRPHGWGASAQNAAVVVDLYRQEEPLPQSLLISDQQYQSSLLTSFESKGNPEERQLRAGKIDGQEALIFVGAERVVTRHAIVHFYCHVYLLVEHHLVRMAVDSLHYSSGSTPRPAEFDQAVRAILGATFEPVAHPSAVLGDSVTPPKMLLPHIVITSVPYPEHALRVGDEGVVDVEFAIDSNGYAGSFRQTYTDLAGLGKDIPIFLNDVLFWLPADWDASQTVSMEFRYSWVGSVRDQCPVKPVHGEVSSVLNICCARAERDYRGGVVRQLFQCHEDVQFR
jgi:hypothetical protein